MQNNSYTYNKNNEIVLLIHGDNLKTSETMARKITIG